MIHASFDDRSHKSAAIAGIYQYDTGQRLKMHGCRRRRSWRRGTIFYPATR